MDGEFSAVYFDRSGLTIPPISGKKREVERLPIINFYARLHAQRVHNSDHLAFICPVCGTVQSMASLIKAGASRDDAGCMVGYTCEGYWTDIGPSPNANDRSSRAEARRLIRGCDWSLANVFRVHELEVVTHDGEVIPWFRVASVEQAHMLEVYVLDRPTFDPFARIKRIFQKS